MQNTFTITYEPTEIAGELGYSYEIFHASRRVRGGWSRGKRHHAERMAKADLHEVKRKVLA